MGMRIGELVISSLTGGQNDTDPQISLSPDQGPAMRNVEFHASTLGERRLGADNIDLTGAGTFSTRDRVVWLHRHLPTSDETASQLWALSVTGTSASTFAYKTTTWSSVTPTDSPTLTSGYQYMLNSVSLHGKLFIAYKSSQNRLHVWDGTVLRRAGIAPASAAPTGANSGGAGTYAGTRYARVRFVQMSGSTVLLRSEPSPTLTISPSGTNASYTITRPTAPGESETDWEIELSTDNANFYRMSRIVLATTTYVDSTALSTGYAAAGTLSDDIGDYTVPISARYLAADEDRLLLGGSFDSDTLASRFSWTPVYNDPGDGNDERVPDDTDNYLNLDGFEGGPITALHGPVNGYSWAFKSNHIYKLVRTGKRSRAYDAFCITKKRGAISRSVVEGVDQQGRPALYFLDPAVGPCRQSADGLQLCSHDIMTTWETVNIDATSVVTCAIFYPDKHQVRWWVATNGANTPNLMFILHTEEMEQVGNGTRRGFTIWDGTIATALCATLYANNIDAATARSRKLVPFMGMEGNGLIWQGEQGNTDNGTAYVAYVQTRPFVMQNITQTFGVMAGTLVAKAASGATLQVSAIRDFGLQTLTLDNQSLTPTASETSVILPMDDLSFSEVRTIALKFSDPATPSGVKWELEQFAYKQRSEGTS